MKQCNGTRCGFFGLLAALVMVMTAGTLFGADPAAPAAQAPAPKNWTAQQDHQNMMEQLGITKLRPGPSGNENAPNHANYDESQANPYPDLPDVLTTKDGRKVTTPEMWWNVRRPEIVEDFDREVLGRVPKDVPKVTWTVTNTSSGTAGSHATVVKRLVGHVDNSACPEINVDIQMTLVTPADAKAPVPVMMMFGFAFGGGGFPQTRPTTGPAVGGARGGFGAGGGFGGGVGGPQTRPAVAGAGGRGGPTTGPARGPGAGGPGGAFGGGPPPTQQLIEAGWGYATLVPNSVQADNGAGLTKGIVGLCNKGQPRKPDDWGALRAWAWGASRGLDYLETDKAVDAKRVGIEGVSRYGKAALITMAYDQRFAVVLVGSSGEGGAKLHRRNFGEAVESLTGTGEYHWMAGNFLKYGAAEAAFGSKTPGDLPVDAHELIAMCAPRATFISYGVPERGDAKWLDQQGSYMATIAAQPVFRLLGVKDLGTGSDDYKNAKMPPVNSGLLDGQLAWRQHDGGHTDGPNWKYFIPWADRMLGRTPEK
jgi:hypothetical protein